LTTKSENVLHFWCHADLIKLKLCGRIAVLFQKRFKVATFYHPLPLFTLFPSTEKNTMGHDHRHAPGGFERVDLYTEQT